jgi:hypothetical protein
MDSSDLRPEDDRERNATLNRIQDQHLCVRNEMENFQWQDVCREFESLLRLLDELVIQLGRLPPSCIKLLDDLDTELRVTACDKKSIRAMSKLNAAAFQLLKVQVKTALDNHLRVIDECKQETAQNSKDKIVSDDSKGESKEEIETSEQKRKKERKKRKSGIASGQEERRIASRPTAFCQAQRPRPSSRALSYVPRRLDDLSASERAAWCVLSPAESTRLNQR